MIYSTVYVGRYLYCTSIYIYISFIDHMKISPSHHFILALCYLFFNTFISPSNHISSKEPKKCRRNLRVEQKGKIFSEAYRRVCMYVLYVHSFAIKKNVKIYYVC